MLDPFQSQPFLNSSIKSGLYEIICLPLNKRYIGESNNLSIRLASHKNMLKQGIHPNSHLQKDFEFYGEERFLFQKLLIGAGAIKKDRCFFETLCVSVWDFCFLYNHSMQNKKNAFLGT